MRMYEIIYKKRQGMRLSLEEIRYLVHGFTSGQIPDYQIGALLMAIFFQGMDGEEIASLTKSMVETGEKINLSSIPGIKVDKHSCGGVGDTVTLVLVPLVSAAGIPVAKMSGRSLGQSGGTIDKLESIPGFVTELEMGAFLRQVEKLGAAIISQTTNLSPADKLFYSLRDVTATVDSIPLIASSIMSKKIAGGADAILLDVKTGRGAFMKSLEEAASLAQVMVDLGKALGRKTKALITDMDQPLGSAVGNALEVKEAIKTLKGEGPFDLLELTLHLGSHMLLLGGKVLSFPEGYDKLTRILDSGQALEQLEKMILAQGGDPGILDDGNRLPGTRYEAFLPSKREGFVTEIDAYQVGSLVMEMGAGRKKKDDAVDYGVGVLLEKKVGDRVSLGESLATLYFQEKNREEEWKERLSEAFRIGEEAGEKRPLIFQEIG